MRSRSDGTRRPILLDLVLTPNEEMRQTYSLFTAERDVLTVETDSATPLGQNTVLWARASALYDMHGTVIGAIESIRDITDRKKAEDAIRQQHDFLQQLIDAIPTPIFYKDVDGRYTGCNRAFESDTGISRADIVGKTVFEVGPPDLAQIYHEQDLSLLRHPGVQQGENRRQDAAGNMPAKFYESHLFGP